jgi:cytochrome c553
MIRRWAVEAQPTEVTKTAVMSKQQKNCLRVAATLSLAFSMGSALAAGAESASTAPTGIAACKACHGPGGISASNTIPNLAGQKMGYLEAQLTAFKSGARKNDFMTVIAGQLSAEDIREFAQYWSSRVVAAAPETKPVPAIPSRMTMPANFPAGYTLYQSVEDKDQGVITKRYANTIAMKAARGNGALPDGSAILQVTYAATPDASGKLVQGDLQSYAGMEARAGWGDVVPALLRNGNWDYATFKADGQRNDALNQAQCLACHKPAATDSYVFSIKELRAAAHVKAAG